MGLLFKMRMKNKSLCLPRLTDEVCKLTDKAGSKAGGRDWKQRDRESVARLQSANSFS